MGTRQSAPSNPLRVVIQVVGELRQLSARTRWLPDHEGRVLLVIACGCAVRAYRRSAPLQRAPAPLAHKARAGDLDAALEAMMPSAAPGPSALWLEIKFRQFAHRPQAPRLVSSLPKGCAHPGYWKGRRHPLELLLDRDTFLIEGTILSPTVRMASILPGGSRILHLTDLFRDGIPFGFERSLRSACPPLVVQLEDGSTAQPHLAVAQSFANQVGVFSNEIDVQHKAPPGAV